MNRTIGGAGLITLVSSGLFAQAPAPPLSFEVASVKPTARNPQLGESMSNKGKRLLGPNGT